MTNVSGVKSDHYQYQNKVFWLTNSVGRHMRQKMCTAAMAFASVDAGTSVLDVGVTCDRRGDCNLFEQMYPHPERLTAVGVEDCAFLEQAHPGLKFFQIDGARLPFEDNSFDLAVSFATIEHVGSRERQRAFISELCRVSRQCSITTPNRWYPLEFHTVMPLIHWLPARVFRSLLRCFGKSFYAREENLNLLSVRELASLVPAGYAVEVKRYRLLGLVSNVQLFIRKV